MTREQAQDERRSRLEHALLYAQRYARACRRGEPGAIDTYWSDLARTLWSVLDVEEDVWTTRH